MKSVCILVQSVYDLDPRVRRKADALVSAGYSVDVLALRADHGKKTYTVNGVNVYTIPLGRERGSLPRYAFEYTAFFLWAFLRISLMMWRRRYVVIDVNTLPDFLIFAAVPAKWMGAKLILDMHEITPEFCMSKYGIAEGSWLVRLLQRLEKISFDFADRVITINEPIQDLLIHRGLRPSKTIVVMNAVDEARFVPSMGAPAFDGNSNAFVFIYHGTLTRVYGLDFAIEAFRMAHTEMPGAELWILGSGPEKDTLANLVRKHGLTSRVRLLGLVSAAEIPATLAKCDVGILPIRRDVFLDFAFPNKLPEFIIMGKAVLMSRLKTIRHYFSEESLAYFEPNNPEDLARQMVRLYWDRDLRARLAARAKKEYVPIRWEIMKQRYVKLIDEATGLGHSGPKPPNVTETTTVPMARIRFSAKTRTDNLELDRKNCLREVRTATKRLLAYCQANGWAGHDPYDALNSKIFTALPLLDSKILRLAFTQALKRSPINIRQLARIPKAENPKAIALFLTALLHIEKVYQPQDNLIDQMIDKLGILRSPGSSYWCWGYSFPWQTRTDVVPRWAPNVVCTSFVANALLGAYERSPQSRCLEMAVSAAEYMVKELYWSEGKSVAGFSYPLPSIRTQIHNANFLAAALLCRVYKHTGDKKFLTPALRVARYSAKRQRSDGSWDYGEAPTQSWIDNFHTGYNLCALHSIGEFAATTEFESCIRRGFDFYRAHFFLKDGAVRYFHNRTYPVDIHCVAQSLITLLAFKDHDADNLRLAQLVFDWAMKHMWDERGFFYYRLLRLCTIRTSYMRWSQAWMLLALSVLLCELNGVVTKPQAGHVFASAGR